MINNLYSLWPLLKFWMIILSNVTYLVGKKIVRHFKQQSLSQPLT